MSDPDAGAVAGRLDQLDKDTWASEAHKASRSELREFMSGLIADETDAYYNEKNADAEWHPWRVMKYGDPDWVPPATTLYTPLSDESRNDWNSQYSAASEDIKQKALEGKKWVLNP